MNNLIKIVGGTHYTNVPYMHSASRYVKGLAPEYLHGTMHDDDYIRMRATRRHPQRFMK